MIVNIKKYTNVLLIRCISIILAFLSGLCRTQDIIITIFSDKGYMDSLYNKLLFIKAMQKEEDTRV